MIDPAVTLSGIAENFKDCIISRAAINKRFTKEAHKFFLGIYFYFFRILRKNSRIANIDLLNKFKAIKIIDSSSWEIPKALKEIFPGYNEAGCKIQLLLDYKTGLMRLLDIVKESFNDQNYSKTLKKIIKQDELWIFDLGYSIIEFLEIIIKKTAFFLSRFNYHAHNLYIRKGEEFYKTDILTILRRAKTFKSITEFAEFYVGNKKAKIKVRFIVIRLPEEVANERRRKAKKAARKQLSKESLELCNWILLMTNIPQEKAIDVKEIILLYPIRWQIELFFKQLKSVLQIHKSEVKSNVYRLRCEILGKCIVALFMSFCYSVASSITWQALGKEISIGKTARCFKRNIVFLQQLLSCSIGRAVDFIKELIMKIIETCQKNRQKSRKNSLDALIDGAGCENLKYIKVEGRRCIHATVCT